MNVNSFLLRPIRILLFPLSLIYALIVKVRNWLFDRRYFLRFFNLPVICVGNLAVGGTGESPMVEWMVAGLMDRFAIAVLSRGYKRKTAAMRLPARPVPPLTSGMSRCSCTANSPGWP